jgi:hypothetical protein
MRGLLAQVKSAFCARTWRRYSDKYLTENLKIERDVRQKDQEHIADIQKLKAAKEMAETKQYALERDMREELERVRTQFMFKVQPCTCLA